MKYILMIMLILAEVQAWSSTDDPKYVTAPVTWISTFMPTVKCTLDGKSEITCLIDTGSNVCLVKDSVARKLKLNRKPALNTDGSPIKIAGKDTDEIDIEEIAIAEVPVAQGIFFTVRDEHLNSAGAKGVDAIIGANFLSVHSILFDVPGSTVTLWIYAPPEAIDLEKFRLSDAVKMDVNISLSTFKIRAEAKTVGETSTYLQFTTGSSLVHIPRSMAETSGKTVANAISLNSFGFSEEAYQMKANKLQIGGIDFTDVPVAFSKVDKQETKFVFGLCIFKDARVLLDMPNKRMLVDRKKEKSDTKGNPGG